MIIEWEYFKVLVDCLAKIKELRAGGKFKESDELRKTLVAKGMKISYLNDGRVKYSCQVRDEKDKTKFRCYGQTL